MSHHQQERQKLGEIKRRNQHLLNKLLDISTGKQSKVNQKNLKVPRGASRSLNYVSKKREAERIDRENQKIMQRIINVKPRMVQVKKLRKDFAQNHLKNKFLIQDRAQGVFIEDVLEVKRRFREGLEEPYLFPKLNPRSSTSVASTSGRGLNYSG